MAIRHYQFDYLIGVILVLKIQQFIKDNTKNIHIKSLKRPRNAKHCNLENNDGDVGNEPGYPSGHMATTSFMTNLYYLKQCKIKTMSNFFLYNIWNLKCKKTWNFKFDRPTEISKSMNTRTSTSVSRALIII